jgi:hypothetical protein
VPQEDEEQLWRAKPVSASHGSRVQRSATEEKE